MLVEPGKIKKKRERPKRFRNKPYIKKISSYIANKRTWNLPCSYQLFHWKKPKFWRPEQIELIQSGSLLRLAEDLISPSCYQDLEGHPAGAFIDVQARNFHENFRLFHLQKSIGYVPSCEGYSAVRSSITRGQLCTFLTSVFGSNFFESLLGAFWPTFIRKLAHNILEAKLREPVIRHETLFDGFHFRDLTWLKHIPPGLQYAVMHNLFLYLSIFAVNTICYAFYITRNRQSQLTIFLRRNWSIIEDYGFKMLSLQRRLQPLTVTPEEYSKLANVSPLHRLKFILKSDDVRPIVTFKKFDISIRLYEIKEILDMIIDENPGIFGFGLKNLKDFPIKYRSFVLSNRRQNNLKTYWATGDVTNCFTSMNHDLLMKILSKLIHENRQFIISKYRLTVKKNGIEKHFPRFTVNGRPVMRKKGWLVEECERRRTYTGRQVLDLIKSFTCQTPINYNGKIFACNRGISQGNPVSVILCNIYMGAMERLIFPEPRISTKILLCRYIDDYFMVSSDKELIVQVLKQFIVGAPSFGVQFSSAKTRLSFDAAVDKWKYMRVLRKNERLSWCGYAFNTKSFTMSLDYSRYTHRRSTSIVPKNFVSIAAKWMWIKRTLKKLLQTRILTIRSCFRLLYYDQKRCIKKRFGRFVMDFYIKKFVKTLRLNISTKSNRLYLKRLLKWVGGFPKKRLSNYPILESL